MTRLVFFGTDGFSCHVMTALIETGYEVDLVVTQPDKPVGRGQKLESPPTVALAKQHGISFVQPEKLSEVTETLSKLHSDIGIVASYGRYIPSTFITRFEHKLINVHPSLLPKYRGASPIEAAILNGDNETGVTIMMVAPEMDAGDILAQTTVPLSGSETSPQLYEKLAEVGAELLINTIPDFLAGKLTPQPQDPNLVSETHQIKKADGEINWKLPAVTIERQVRAYLGWPGSRTKLAGVPVTITEAHTAESDLRLPSSVLRIKCGDAQYLVIDKLKPAGKNEMTGPAFLAGHKL